MVGQKILYFAYSTRHYLGRVGHSHNFKQRGFTLLEVMIVMGLIAAITAISTVNLARPQTAASMVSVVDGLRADLRGQQLRAMSGDTAGSATAQTHGIRIEASKYTLFAGTYSAGNADNFETAVDTGITLSTTLSGGQVSFLKGTGEIAGLTSGNNTITITDSRSGDSKIIRLNRYGTVTLQ